VLLTVLSRIGQNSRVVLTHDVAQRDNLRVGRHDGVASVMETLKGHQLFAHITLTRSERSAIAAIVNSSRAVPITGICTSMREGRQSNSDMHISLWQSDARCCMVPIWPRSSGLWTRRIAMHDRFTGAIRAAIGWAPSRRGDPSNFRRRAGTLLGMWQ
jgi:hypothetical protein